MKKHGILNSSIAKVLADMGHTDSIAIGDAGLPIPLDVEKIDVALREGLPSFLDTFNAVSDDMHIETLILAEEIKTENPKILEAIRKRAPKVDIVFVLHERFKELLSNTRAVVRTGEVTPYANVIMVSGVSFLKEDDHEN